MTKQDYLELLVEKIHSTTIATIGADGHPQTRVIDMMDKVNGKLTIFFEEPFWVGIFERIEDGKLSAAKVIFGAEPKDCEVQEYIQKWYFSLKFSPVVETVVKDIKRNPKRMQREAKKQMLEIGIGTKSQQALKLQQEQNKQERKEKSRKRKEAEEQRMFELKQRKKLEENAKK